MLIILLVAAWEIITVLLMNNLVFPALSPLIFGGKTIVDYDISTVFVFFLYVLVRVFVQFISRYFPIGLTGWDDRLIEKMTVFDGNVLVEHYEELGILTRVIMMAAIIVVVLLLIAPIIIAGTIFSVRVVKKFSELEREEREKKALYEKKRNLMLSDIAHDLRTPITTIYGYSQAILDGKASDEKQEEYLKLISMKSKKVDELINLLFDYVKMDSDGFTLHKEKTDLAELTRQCGGLLYQDIADAGMELYADIPEEEIEIEADKVQLSRVITNLISNAIKHNPEGTKIGLLLFGKTNDWKLYVADNGTAIDEKSAEDIFEPFVTGDESRQSKGGSGLGLSIARKVTRLHGFDLKLLQGDKIPYKIQKEGFTKCFEIR